jgi:hypothetical protein
MPLDPEIAMLITEIDANLSHAESIAHRLTPEQFQWRPAAKRWSIGECIAHMNLANAANLPALESGIARGRSRGLNGEGPFVYGWLMRRIIRSQEPPVTRRFNSPNRFLPASELDPEATLAEHYRIGAELKRLAKEANGLDLAKIKIQLPALPALPRAIVRVPWGGWLAFITTHDRRHLWQAEQVRNDPAFPSTLDPDDVRKS